MTTPEAPARLGVTRRLIAGSGTFTCANHPERPGAWLMPDGTLRCDRCHLGADSAAAAVTAERQRIADWLLGLASDPVGIDDWKERHCVPGKYAGMALRGVAADLTSGEPIPGLDDEPVAVAR